MNKNNWSADDSRDTKPLMMSNHGEPSGDTLRYEKLVEDSEAPVSEEHISFEPEKDKEEMLYTKEEAALTRQMLAEERDEQEQTQPSTKEKVLSWVIPFALAIGIAVLVRLFVGGVTTVQGNSMHPTLSDGDLLIINKLPTYTQDYERAEIVIIDAPQEPGRLYVKRIIGMPNETVQIHNGHVFINGRQLKENYIDNLDTTIYSKDEWKLGPDEYFVMGDNRVPGASNDGRLFGPIAAKHIRGIALFRLWPLNHMGTLF